MNDKDIIQDLSAMKGQIKRKPKSQLNYLEDYKKYCAQMVPNDSEKKLEEQYYEEYQKSSTEYAKELDYLEKDDDEKNEWL